MSKKTWIIGGVAVLAIAGATILGRSLNHANDSKGSTGSNKVTTLKVAHTQNYVPYDFVDEKGNEFFSLPDTKQADHLVNNNEINKHKPIILEKSEKESFKYTLKNITSTTVINASSKSILFMNKIF